MIRLLRGRGLLLRLRPQLILRRLRLGLRRRLYVALAALAVLAVAGAIVLGSAAAIASAPANESAPAVDTAAANASAALPGDAVFLEILDASSGRAYSRWPVNDGDEFAIEFIHSVNQSPVRETFKVEGGGIGIESVRFYSFGAGMQSDVEAGQTMVRDGDALIISGYSRAVSELNYIVGTVSDHLLFVNGETISLRELCGRNAHITLRVRSE